MLPLQSFKIFSIKCYSLYFSPQLSWFWSWWGNFCSSQEGVWLGPGGYSTPSCVIFWGRAHFWTIVVWWREWLGIILGVSPTSNCLPLSCTLCLKHCCYYCMFSCLIAVSYLLSFTFYASNSPLQPAEEKGSHGTAHGFSGNTELENTAPKTQQPSLVPNVRHKGLR